jgi:hypothetical protein
VIFIDANVFMYAAGKPHPYKAACVSLLEQVAKAGSLHDYCTNTEVLQEILHRYRAIKVPELGFKVFDLVLNLGLTIYPVELSDLAIALKLLVSHPKLSTRDAVHLGVAIRRDVSMIVSYDQDFSHYTEIERREPETK